ncbi:MAG: ATP-dependent 6-phosphofructokinase [Pirellulaceae bacterium]|nr:ATP-dependent 6-phosphofructokinase [Pirellulaceae bacterium]
MKRPTAAPVGDMAMRIGVFCSGGDAPGMNACIRAVVRSALSRKHEVIGIRRGYEGLLEENFWSNTESSTMTLRSVSDLGKLGGAMLHSSRSDEFRTPAGQQKAAAILRKNNIDALIPIGGDGTLQGAVALAQYWDGQIVGCPGTIDNDLIGTDYTIGFSTAVQTAVDAVDKIRDTADSHVRMFLIEVMGRHSGYIAIHSALAGAAECVCIPETPTDVEQLVKNIKILKGRGKTSVLMIVAEGDETGGALQLQQRLVDADCPFGTRCVILGHLQRGGSPTPEDRILASRLGDFAVRSIQDGANGVMAGVIANQCQLTPFQETYARHKAIPVEYVELLETLSV